VSLAQQGRSAFHASDDDDGDDDDANEERDFREIRRASQLRGSGDLFVFPLARRERVSLRREIANGPETTSRFREIRIRYLWTRRARDSRTSAKKRKMESKLELQSRVLIARPAFVMMYAMPNNYYNIIATMVVSPKKFPRKRIDEGRGGGPSPQNVEEKERREEEGRKKRNNASRVGRRLLSIPPPPASRDGGALARVHKGKCLPDIPAGRLRAFIRLSN